MKIPYFDYQATTPTDERVVEAMQPYWNENFANPHATIHNLGENAETAIENAKKDIAFIIGANSSEIIFTSGATESNNLAIHGILPSLIKKNKPHIITSNIEHNSILKTCNYLKEIGAKVTYIPVNKNGIVDINILKSSITNKTGLISIMAVNNEIGTIQPIKEIGEICKQQNIIFHVDGAQAIGKIPFSTKENNIDMLSISAHKLYGPKGIGALYIRRNSRIVLKPLILGGAQERGLRSGTLPTPLCVGFAKACLISVNEMDKENSRILNLRNILLENIKSNLDKININGDINNRIAGNLNISFCGVYVKDVEAELKNKIAVSFGSACSSGRTETSHVINAIDSTCGTAIRFGIGRFTTKDDINKASKIIIDTINKLRN